MRFELSARLHDGLLSIKRQHPVMRRGDNLKNSNYIRCMNERTFYVYILARSPRGKLYTGVTNNLLRRTYEHKHGIAEGYTKQHAIKQLVYYEAHQDVNIALQREKLIKKWRRAIKYEAIESMNPHWEDLYDFLVG